MIKLLKEATQGGKLKQEARGILLSITLTYGLEYSETLPKLFPDVAKGPKGSRLTLSGPPQPFCLYVKHK